MYSIKLLLSMFFFYEFFVINSISGEIILYNQHNTISPLVHLYLYVMK